MGSRVSKRRRALTAALLLGTCLSPLPAWAIDVAKGKKVRRVDVPHPDALGNLVLHRGLLVSQSVTHIAAFPLTPKLP